MPRCWTSSAYAMLRRLFFKESEPSLEQRDFVGAKNDMKFPASTAWYVSLAIAAMSAAQAASRVEEEDIALVYGDKSFVSVATGARQPIARAPSAATVITAAEIEAMGASDLDEVLETVPGLHVARSTIAYAPIYTIRGIRKTLLDTEVLVLINGISIKGAYGADKGNIWGGLPVENIARIEVIRGPGSAVYGADAFSGVINIITKAAADVEGTRIGARGGSFHTWDTWMLHGGKWGNVDSEFYLRAGGTKGPHEIITRDNQTGLDALFATNASLAPGPVNRGRDAVDAHLDLSQGKWRFRTDYRDRYNVGSGAGVAQTLAPNDNALNERFLTDLTYQDPNFAKDWDVTLQLSYFHIKEVNTLTLFPPGAFGGTFPNGMIGNPDRWESDQRLGLSSFYTGFAKHKVGLGTGWASENLYKVRESKNFIIAGPLPTPLPGGVTDVSETAPYIFPHARRIQYFYVQDEWAFIKDWYLTAGVRHDHYSDFGSTTNPRLALVWEIAYDLTAKILYGRAFRAPSFAELYNINNPAVTGNPNINPETIETTEAILSWHPAKDFELGLSVFTYRMHDVIRYLPNPDPTTGTTAQNAGTQVGHGFEVEASWDATRTLQLSGNYAYQNSFDEFTQQDAGDAPHDHLYLRADWRFTPGWALNTQLNWVANRKRAANDTRANIPDYHTVDIALRHQAKRDAWGITFSIHNLFNADAREPSPAPGLIPNDLPLPGRWYLLQAHYQL